ncbi:MAG TPA: methyltransferase domain-containing protein [Flavobacterium sp.]|uniref:class I SAM-dependent DNA methyltransferase n=1 Tax=Flavobacterium sp. TaxID=239 RepID=UPI002CCE90EC|nr:methyltransferase domain-containing protein [Flavobacterium sp.]HNP32272.1 methyltransferase domain-containing protein [Flavobacterium sp.]
MNRNQTTIQTWDKLAQKYQDKFMEMDIYDDSYDLFCQAVANENASIFEIGCGPGNITKYLLGKHQNYKILATDVAPSMIDLAEKNNPSAEFKIMDARNINEINQKFDAVMCGFCMPYLSKEESIQLIKNSHALLKDGGILYFSVIENDYEKSELQTSSDGQHTMFVYYHQADYLQKVLDECGFKTLHLLRINYEKSEGVFDTHLIFIVKK